MTYVVLVDFQGSVSLSAGTLISTPTYDVAALQAEGLAVAVYSAGMAATLAAYASPTTATSPTSERPDLVAMLVGAGLIGGSGSGGISALTGDVTASGSGSVVATVAGIQGSPVSAVAPTSGQVLAWTGSEWVPAAPPSGGSGGGLVFYLNEGTAPQAPTTGIPVPATAPVRQIGPTSVVAGSTVTSGTLSQVSYDLVANFVSDVGVPDLTSIPAGLWDFHVWASSNANQSNQTVFRIEVGKYDGSTAPTLIAASDDVSIYDPTVVAQYAAQVVIPAGTTLLATDRLYVAIFGKATQNSRTISLYFGDATPSHVATTLPSPAGGDLSGTYPNPTVVALQGYPVSATTPGTGESLVWSAGTASWEPTLIQTYPPGGASNSLQANGGSGFSGATYAEIQSGNLTLTQNVGATAATADTVQVYERTFGREAITAIGSTGREWNVGRDPGRTKYGAWGAQGGVSSVPVGEGISNMNTNGNATTRTPSLTSFIGSLRRLGLVSNSAGAGNTAGWRFGALWFWRGDAALRGGFYLVQRFAPSPPASVTSNRYFVGLNGAATGTAATNPSAWLNIIGLGCDAGSANFSIMHNDGSGTATQVALGANFPANTSSTDLYELILYAPPNGSTVSWRVENFTKGAALSGTISSDLPASTQGLNILGWAETTVSGVVAAIDFVSMYIETEF